ncbi:ubiquitin carboxyl-terminal hydrolase 4-like [Planococcus citri]|uniref:ubiquitin carboxyl-terminal hydrolase 4-like n=1 Tax=Planococcus citri TaxID=170843 RepID=UPI0031F9746F
MDLGTSGALVAEVNSQLIDRLGSSRSENYTKNQNFQFESSTENEFGNEDEFLEQDYVIDSKITSTVNSVSDANEEFSVGDSNFRHINFGDSNFSNDSVDYPFPTCNIELNQYCETEVADLIDDNILNDKGYNHVLLNPSENINPDEDALKYDNLGTDVSSASNSIITADTILEENSELVHSGDQNDFNALNDFLSIPLSETEDIGPHFIAGSFSNSGDKLDSNKNQGDSSDMGIENTWNEDFAVPSTSNFPLPLPAPPESSTFSDFSSCNNFDSVEHGSYTSDLEALFSTNETETDVTDVNADKGVCGLRNLGNTCFMSTGIQCLVATTSLVRFFLKKLSASNLDENSLTMQFTELLQKMWSGQYSIVHPMKFKQALGSYYPQFKDCSQHDCQEFLALLLDALHQQLVTVSKEGFEDDDAFSFKDKIPERETDMDMKIDGVSSDLPRFKCDTFYEFVNNGNNEMSSNATEEIESKTESQKSSADETEKSSMEVIDGLNSKDDGEEQKNSALASKLNYIQDILKETKTSNVNVLVKETEANNEICFDSGKFPKKERRRNIAKTNYHDIYANDTNVVQKDSGFYFGSESNFDDNLDLKRIKVNHLTKEKNCLMEDQNYKDTQMEKNVRLANERKMKILNVPVKQSNTDEQMETDDGCVNNDEVEEEEMRTEDENEIAVQMSEEESQSADDLEAEKHWEKHVFNNRSVIFDSFQGQFKNTVVCSACDFKSITYEPFMYLSVPLPHAIEKQLCVTFVSASDSPPVQYLITLTKQDEVMKIKHHLLKMIPEKLEHPIVIGEVLDYHIAKILDDNHQIRYLDDVNRSIYAFEQLYVTPKDKNDTTSCENSSNCGDKEPVNAVSDACAICLEEKESNVRRHKDCACTLCDVCIQNYSQHYGGQTLKCPVCRTDIIPEKDLLPIEQADMKSNMRLLNVPLVYRMDKTGDGNNNQKTVKLFGHPALLRLPNQISAEELYETVSRLHPYKEPFKLLLVDGQGRHCSRCMYNQPCKGCAISRDSDVLLRSDDTLAVTFTDDIVEIGEKRHSSMTLMRNHKTLSLYDCVQAFSQSEILDEFNPWYCPRCEKNQCATKTLSVWRFPNYLIVYLKRFVFHECTSIKLEDKVKFPLHGFNFNKKNESPYDLYACVCHTGGVSVGHYIAYTQNPLTSEWHCFNDENVSKQKPQEEEYCNAYILFYKKRDASDVTENE